MVKNLISSIRLRVSACESVGYIFGGGKSAIAVCRRSVAPGSLWAALLTFLLFCSRLLFSPSALRRAASSCAQAAFSRPAPPAVRLNHLTNNLNNMNKNLLKTFLVAVGLAAGTMGVWAQSESIYERGISTNWSENDLSDWTAVTAGTTFEISDGLKTGGENGSYEYSKTISTTENSKITINATWNTGSSTGRNGSYNYLSFGDIQFRAYGQDKKATVAFGGDETVLSTAEGDVRYDAEWNILLTINKFCKIWRDRKRDLCPCPVTKPVRQVRVRI